MQSRISSLADLHPKFRGLGVKLDEKLALLYQTHRTQFRFKVFETLRLPSIQADALKEGVSKAGPWQSPHQYGLAIDFVPYVGSSQGEIAARKAIDGKNVPGWIWPNADWDDWEVLRTEAHALGLVTISWDKPHVEHPIFDELKDLLF